MEQGVIQSSGIIMNRGGILGNFGGIIITDSDTLDPDAAARISEIEAAGATVSPTQAAAINTFFVDAKADGYYSSLKRLYLPIWGVAAANAIDLITGAVGTFNGGVTHGAGFVQGNGTTGYFGMGVTNGDISAGQSNFHMAAGRITDNASNSSFIGCLVGGSSQCYMGTGGGATFSAAYAFDGVSSSKASKTGIFIFNTDSPTNGYFSVLNTASRSSNVDASVGGTIITALEMQTMRRNFNGTGDSYDSSRHIFWSIGLSMSNAQADLYTSSMKTLWETCTGNVLP